MLLQFIPGALNTTSYAHEPQGLAGGITSPISKFVSVIFFTAGEGVHVGPSVVPKFPVDKSVKGMVHGALYAYSTEAVLKAPGAKIVIPVIDALRRASAVNFHAADHADHAAGVKGLVRHSRIAPMVLMEWNLRRRLTHRAWTNTIPIAVPKKKLAAEAMALPIAPIRACSEKRSPGIGVVFTRVPLR